MRLINQNKNKDEYWLQVDLPDGKTAIYKDGQAFDLDTGLPVEL